MSCCDTHKKFKGTWKLADTTIQIRYFETLYYICKRALLKSQTSPQHTHKMFKGTWKLDGTAISARFCSKKPYYTRKRTLSHAHKNCEHAHKYSRGAWKFAGTASLIRYDKRALLHLRPAVPANFNVASQYLCVSSKFEYRTTKEPYYYI